MTYTKSTPLTGGRIDGTSDDVLRWHQAIQYINLENDEIPLGKNKKGIVLLNFAVDEGVRRNKGRIGAAEGPQSIMQALANFPTHFENTTIFHGGIITCTDGSVENSHVELASYVEKILRAGCLPIVLGGGHEVTYGHYLGIKNFLRQKKKNNSLGIINFDAHFDIRPIEEKIGATSGTSIWQIANESKNGGEPFHCLALGIQKYANTKLLFDLADKFGVEYALGDEINYENKNALIGKIEKFIDSVDHVYFTICMDAFAASFAPGVSAPSPSGVIPDHVFTSCFDLIAKSKKFIALDFAETNPKFDIDSRTAKLAASLIFRAVSN